MYFTSKLCLQPPVSKAAQQAPRLLNHLPSLCTISFKGVQRQEEITVTDIKCVSPSKQKLLSCDSLSKKDEILWKIIKKIL